MLQSKRLLPLYERDLAVARTATLHTYSVLRALTVCTKVSYPCLLDSYWCMGPLQPMFRLWHASFRSFSTYSNSRGIALILSCTTA